MSFIFTSCLHLQIHGIILLYIVFVNIWQKDLFLHMYLQVIFSDYYITFSRKIQGYIWSIYSTIT